jgi:hypothetical protein
MRDMTRAKIEDYASRHDVALVSLEVAEKGIEVGRQMMAEMIAGYSQDKRQASTEMPHAAEEASTAATKTTILNEIPSMPGTHT